MTTDTVVSIAGMTLTLMLNVVALIVFITKMSERLKNLADATDKLACAVEKMDAKLDDHEVRITVLENK